MPSSFSLPNRIRQLGAPPFALAILASGVFAFFAPILPTYFLADDYNYVGHLLVHARAYVQGDELGKWFVDFSAQGLQNPELSVFFRPVVQWLWLTDFVAYGTNAFGYHLTNIILHALNAFLVYLIATQVLRNRFAALTAGLLFALHPIHSDSVAWIADRTDVLSTLFYFSSIAFFVLFRARARRLFAALAVIAFALAIGTKENTVALPVLLLAYDFLFTFRALRWKILRAQIPYWLALAGYVAARFFFLGEFGRNTGGGWLSYGAGLFAQFYTQALAEPFIPDINEAWLIGAFTLITITLAIYRARAGVWFGAAWIAISLLPATSAAYVAPRLAYAPSAGLALALAAIIAQPLARERQWARAASIALFAFFIGAYGWGLAARVDNWVAAGALSDSIRTETLRLHPTVPADARFYFTGVPDTLRTIHVYNDNFDTAIRIIYRNPALRVERGERFPLIAAELDRTYLLEFRRRKITERTDLIQALQARLACASKPAITWDFARDLAGWETWHQLAAMPARDGAMELQAQGDDPNFGSPRFEFPAFALGEIEIEMRARGDAPATQGKIFWTVNEQTDFSPAQQFTFPVQLDGAWHTYRVPLITTGKLLLGDRLTRLRLDPVAMPAEIALKTIRINRVCAETEGVLCTCPR